MKKDIHPEYFEDATINCSCGAKYQIGSTRQTIEVELCAACHPFYTGEQKILDTARRVEKFQERAAKKTGGTASKAAKKAVKRAKRAEKGPKYEIEETKTATIKKVTKKKVAEK
ncbi:MAG: 50S ribosomal protein L31 [Candidatus Uhrbacteria bacterium]|nr:50S ribosomal protein L31 [Patescibacteria group bacterium]MBU1906693.1 50S ribosomal protein L31 [Patescibacteria group bacterium]